MNEIELIEWLAKCEHLSLSKAAINSGLSRNTINNAKSSGSSLKTANTCAILDGMGYTLAAVPHSSELPEGSYIITPRD